APHILENHRLLLRSCFLNAVYSFLEILEETETTFVPVPFFLSQILLFSNISKWKQKSLAK
ncbi:MAG: hypothetical protein E6X39_12675, partial [Enterococcus hirae]|nr:hypothetical protein [Enterococcus hirae]